MCSDMRRIEHADLWLFMMGARWFDSLEACAKAGRCGAWDCRQTDTVVLESELVVS